jgi:uncharacterized membrane protein YecN with MAPEG domain
MSKCPVCQSRKVVRVSVLKNQWLCKKCSAELTLKRIGQTVIFVEYLPAFLLLVLVVFLFLTGNNIFFFIAIGGFLILLPIYYALGRRVVYIRR